MYTKIGTTERLPRVGDLIYHDEVQYEVLIVKDDDKSLQVRHVADNSTYIQFYGWHLFHFKNKTINKKTGRRQ